MTHQSASWRSELGPSALIIDFSHLFASFRADSYFIMICKSELVVLVVPRLTAVFSKPSESHYRDLLRTFDMPSGKWQLFQSIAFGCLLEATIFLCSFFLFSLSSHYHNSLSFLVLVVVSFCLLLPPIDESPFCSKAAGEVMDRPTYLVSMYTDGNDGWSRFDVRRLEVIPYCENCPFCLR